MSSPIQNNLHIVTYETLTIYSVLRHHYAAYHANTLSLYANPSYTITLPHGVLRYIPHCFTNAQALHDSLLRDVCWSKDEICVYGTYHTIPHMQAWYDDKPYTYLGLKVL